MHPTLVATPLMLTACDSTPVLASQWGDQLGISFALLLSPLPMSLQSSCSARLLSSRPSTPLPQRASRLSSTVQPLDLPKHGTVVAAHVPGTTPSGVSTSSLRGSPILGRSSTSPLRPTGFPWQRNSPTRLLRSMSSTPGRHHAASSRTVPSKSKNGPPPQGPRPLHQPPTGFPHLLQAMLPHLQPKELFLRWPSQNSFVLYLSTGG